MKTKIIKSYFHPIYPHEIIVVELEKDGKPLRKQILMDEVLEHLISVPSKSLPDKKLLKKANELVLEALEV
jgi:hypothetical protein